MRIIGLTAGRILADLQIVRIKAGVQLQQRWTVVRGHGNAVKRVDGSTTQYTPDGQGGAAGCRLLPDP